jgi:EAL domain-containing protein (putative c-di-GMP-specific phosphodiesterase class I)/CheY-like chemotaxis protein
VLRAACEQNCAWGRAGLPHVVVSVNVSARQFVPGLIEVVATALSASGAEPGSLCIELTEAFLMDDTEGAVVILKALAALGVVLSIDDFGTGYSSLSRLKRFPMHELKIDKSFVEGLGRNTDDTAIVSAVVAMAHALDLSVVAEGVETVDQLDQLRVLGCEQAQGYYLARPGPPDNIDALLRAETNLGWRSRSRSARASDASPTSYRPNRILVVDDAANVRQLAHMSLSAVGFEVHEAADGITALATARRVAPDCILLDLALPDMRGVDVCRALRAEPTTAACTILILTVTDHAVDKVEAFSSGADDYIIKPFSPRDLVSRVHAAMRRRREGGDPEAQLAARRG